MIDQPLSLREVEELAQNEGRSMRQDPRKVSHFLARVIATIRRHQEETRQLRVEIERGRMQSATAGTPTTLSPMDALRYISDDDKAKLFGQHAQLQLEYMKRKQQEAAEAVKNATTLVQTLKYLLGGVDQAVASHPAIQGAVEAVKGYEAAQRALEFRVNGPQVPQGPGAGVSPSPWGQAQPQPQGPSGPSMPNQWPSAPGTTPPAGPQGQNVSPWAQGPSA